MFRTGDLYIRTIDTSQGPVDIWAEIRVEGRTLHLKDVAIFGRGEPMTGLVRNFLAARHIIKEEARREGFEAVRITGERIPSSTSGNPGKIVDVWIDLAR